MNVQMKPWLVGKIKFVLILMDLIHVNVVLVMRMMVIQFVKVILYVHRMFVFSYVAYKFVCCNLT